MSRLTLIMIVTLTSLAGVVIMIKLGTNNDPSADPGSGSASTAVMPQQPSQHRPNQQTPPPQTQPEVGESSSGAESHGDDHGAEADEEFDAPTPQPPPAKQARAATQAAVRFVNAYKRPDNASRASTKKAWWDAVAPLMTPQAQQDYSGTDPANITITKITGPGKITPVMTEADLVTLVVVPTNIGSVTVHLVGPDQKVSRLTFPNTGDR